MLGNSFAEHVDQVIAVPAPVRCECGGKLKVESIKSQYQQEIVRKTIWRRFDIPICRCQLCHKRVQGRDPRDRKSTRLNSSHGYISYAVFCLKKKTKRLGLTRRKREPLVS